MSEPRVVYLNAVDDGPRNSGPYSLEHRDGDRTAYVPVSGPSTDAKPIPLFSHRDIGLR